MCAARRKRPERWNSNEKKVNSYHDPLDGVDRILVMRQPIAYGGKHTLASRRARMRGQPTPARARVTVVDGDVSHSTKTQ
jgi:hypothetical protein